MRIFKAIIVDVKDRQLIIGNFMTNFTVFTRPRSPRLSLLRANVRPSCPSVRKQEGAQCFNAFRCMNETIVENHLAITQVSSDFIARGSNMRCILFFKENNYINN